jgi:LPS-assembly protein
MKNSFIIILLSLFLFKPLLSETLNIESKTISIDKKTKLSIFRDDVTARDVENNLIKTNYAEFQKDLELFKSKGKTTILTSEGYFLTGEDIIFDNKKKIITSGLPAVITDLEKNKIYLKNFEYFTDKKFFKSIDDVRLVDSRSNTYNFSQIYIDEIKKEIVGSDIKAFLNDNDFKINKNNKPRVFANTASFKNNNTKFNKSVFTLCDYRENDKCPPWTMEAKEMNHDQSKKTIYYDNAVIKLYDFPIFYLPRLSHPDPSVDRRSGFLPPSFSDSKNLGAGFALPYFWAPNKDKDLTITSRLFESEHPLFLSEYRQVFKKSNLILDLGYTEGYKNTSTKKTSGDKSHLFTKFIKKFKGKNNSTNNIGLTLQNVSNDKYLKLYKIKTDLVDYEIDSLESTLSFSRETNKSFLGARASLYETLKNDYNDKYEYVLPDIILDRNLISNEKVGSLDLQANLKVHNYDTNKFEKFFINDLDWKFRKFNFPSGLESQILGKFKNVNYEAKNTNEYKDDTTSEIFGALGYLTKLNLFKKSKNSTDQLLTPKLLLRYAPGQMRKDFNDATKLNNLNIFSLDRLNSYNNFENGLSATVGFDYDLRAFDKELDLSVGQVINHKENKDMPSSTSLDKKLSDLVGSSTLKLNGNMNLLYNFKLDQNYKELNYNEMGAQLDFNPIKFDINYLQEKKHVGNQEYLKTNIELLKGDNGVFSIQNKRDLITNSSEYYNLSYEYLNDCLRAGLVYRREFYNDSELEAENSLMFKITLTPFGNINSPNFNQ